MTLGTSLREHTGVAELLERSLDRSRALVVVLRQEKLRPAKSVVITSDTPGYLGHELTEQNSVIVAKLTPYWFRLTAFRRLSVLFSQKGYINSLYHCHRRRTCIFLRWIVKSINSSRLCRWYRLPESPDDEDQDDRTESGEWTVLFHDGSAESRTSLVAENTPASEAAPS